VHDRGYDFAWYCRNLYLDFVKQTKWVPCHPSDYTTIFPDWVYYVGTIPILFTSVYQERGSRRLSSYFVTIIVEDAGEKVSKYRS
jgi:hypothetical protein